MMPSVVPMPSSRISPLVIVLALLTSWPAATTMNATAITVTTMLLTTGVHIGAAKWPRAFRMAPASEDTP